MWDHNFEKDTILKSPLQTDLYCIAEQAGIISNSSIVAGPAVERHLLDGRSHISKTAKSLIRIVEIDSGVHAEQKMKVKEMCSQAPGNRPKLWLSKVKKKGRWIGDVYYPWDHKVEFFLGDIADAPPERFIDADLMGTVDKIGPTLITVLSNQRETFDSGNFLKCFIFTVCIRPTGLKDTLSWIKDQLLPVIGCNGCTIGSSKYRMTETPESRVSAKNYKGISVHWFEEIFYSNRCSMEDFVLCQYHDDAMPMLTGMIIYR